MRQGVQKGPKTTKQMQKMQKHLKLQQMGSKVQKSPQMYKKSQKVQKVTESSESYKIAYSIEISLNLTREYRWFVKILCFHKFPVHIKSNHFNRKLYSLENSQKYIP